MLLSKIAPDQTLQGFHLRRQTANPQSGSHLRLYFRKIQLHNYESVFVEQPRSYSHWLISKLGVASYVRCLLLIDASFLFCNAT